MDISFFGWAAFEVAVVLDGLDWEGEEEDLEGAVVGFLGGFVFLFVLAGEAGLLLTFLGGSLGIFFFFSSAIVYSKGFYTCANTGDLKECRFGSCGW